MSRVLGKGTFDAASSDAPRVDREGGAVALRLAIGRDGLGVELARPAVLECLDVVELVVRLPHVRFPFDVSGGVAKFRHKRGELEQLAVEIDARRFERWAEPRLHGLLADGACEVHVAPRGHGATISLFARHAGRQGPEALAGLAFEVAIVPGADDVSLVVHEARGVRLDAPATTLALRAMAALMGDTARREGSRFVVSRPAERLARRLLPDAGVRAPSGAGVVFGGSGESDGVLFAIFARGRTPNELPAEITRAFESVLLAREGDDARWAGDLERARSLDLVALERAPRHPELARRIAEIDRVVGGRAEAAVATLRGAASSGRPAADGGLLGGLLAEIGDVAGAIAALVQEGEREASHVIAALVFAEAAALSDDPHEALRWLDAAVARAPRVAELRWTRARRRLAVGRLADARADFQELEALASGPRARFEILRRAADESREVGLGAEAATLYERALLYRPSDPASLAGLGAALAAEGRVARGAALLAHAIDEAGKRALPTSSMELALGRVLGDRVGDRSAAVARLRSIPDEAPEAIGARGLEGRYRAALGDASGASLAFARLRERAGNGPEAVPWLDEAARFETERGDLRAAQAHLAAALAIARDAEVEARYRTIGERIAAEAGVKKVEVPAHVPPQPAPEAEPLDDGAAELRVEDLTRKLQGDPSNEAVVDELVTLLSRLGRSMELFALLSARLEDAPAERREALLPRHREVLAKLEADARAEGREGEADLFKLARESS